MIFLSLDFETTGVEVSTDRVIEFGAVLYSTGQKKCLENQGMLVKSEIPITPAITCITNIHPVAVEKFGYEDDQMLDIVLDMASNADAYLGHSIRKFDYLMLLNWAKRHERKVPNKLIIDIFQDLPWKVPVGKLTHMAADHGILNLFPHSAMADAQTALAIANKYDENLLVQRAKSPVVILRSQQSRNENDLVKQAPFKFRWNPTNKIWWRPAKEQDVEEIMKEAPFKIAIEKGWTQEELDN